MASRSAESQSERGAPSADSPAQLGVIGSSPSTIHSAQLDESGTNRFLGDQPVVIAASALNVGCDRVLYVAGDALRRVADTETKSSAA